MSPEEPEDRVARLLGQVGAERPEVPPEVQARLEATLAGLVQERAAPDQVGRGNARRGRWLLAAAAAVIVMGAGGITVAALSGQSTDRSASTAGGAAADSRGPAAPGASIPLKGSDTSEGARTGRLPLIRSDHAAHDVRALLRRDARRPGTAHRQPPATAVDCPGPPGVPQDQARTVLFDRVPASLVLRTPRVAEVWSCSGVDRLLRVRLPAP